MSQEEMFQAIQQGLVAFNDFESWCYELIAQAIDDAEYAESAHGVYLQYE